MRRVLFNDGEGLVHDDLNLIAKLSDRALTRYSIAHAMRTNLEIDGGWGGGPYHVAGASPTLSGTENRTVTIQPGIWCMGDTAFDPTADYATDDPEIILLDQPSTVLQLDAATSGTAHRRDLVEIQLDAESSVDSESRTVEDAATRALSTASLFKRRTRRIRLQVKKGVDAASEALAMEPAATAGWTKIYCFYVPPTGSSVSNGFTRERFICFNRYRVNVSAFSGPALQGSINAAGYWVASATTQTHRMPLIGVDPGSRLLRIDWTYRNDANPGANKTFEVRRIAGPTGADSQLSSAVFTGTPSAVQVFSYDFMTALSGVEIPREIDSSYVYHYLAFTSGGISDRIYGAVAYFDRPFYSSLT